MMLLHGHMLQRLQIGTQCRRDLRVTQTKRNARAEEIELAPRVVGVAFEAQRPHTSGERVQVKAVGKLQFVSGSWSGTSDGFENVGLEYVATEDGVACCRSVGRLLNQIRNRKEFLVMSIAGRQHDAATPGDVWLHLAGCYHAAGQMA